MKWDAAFVKKLYFINMFGQKGVFYDDKRVEGQYFKFLEETANGKEDKILKMLRK